MGYKLIAQVVLIVTSLVIIFTFINPSFETIRATQNETYQYQEAVGKATELNARLQELVMTKESFDPADLDKLERLVPTKIDKLQVMKDIESIFENRSIKINSLSANDEISPALGVTVEGQPVVEGVSVTYQDFEITFTGTYEQLKEVLTLMEANATLLEIMELNFEVAASSDETVEGSLPQDTFEFMMLVRAFGLNSSANPN